MDGRTLKSTAQTLKYVPNIKWISVNFSSLHKTARTELWISVTLGLWALASTIHLMHNYGKDTDSFITWIIEILLAAVFAAGFGWHVHKLVALHRMEKRGEPNSFNKELRTL